MESLPQETLEPFLVRAKQSTYVGGSRKLLPYRLGSKDLQCTGGDWAYHDSYLGESAFIGQEIVYVQRKPVWGMNYFGVIRRPDTITSSQAGQMLRRLRASRRIAAVCRSEYGGRSLVSGQSIHRSCGRSCL
jgi:Domain of unknown function (DUF5680)